MKPRLFFGGLLIGVAIGLMVGGAIVEIPADGTGKRRSRKAWLSYWRWLGE